MNFSNKTQVVVFDDLVAKLRILPSRHPERLHIARMIRDLGREIESKPLPQGELFPFRWPAGGPGGRSLSADRLDRSINYLTTLRCRGA